MPRHQHVNTSHSGGLSVSQAWQRLFQLNEQQPSHLRMTDTQIQRVMLAMFPDRTPSKNIASHTAVARARAAYNRGALPGMADTPPPPSHRSYRYIRITDTPYPSAEYTTHSPPGRPAGRDPARPPPTARATARGKLMRSQNPSSGPPPPPNYLNPKVTKATKATPKVKPL